MYAEAELLYVRATEIWEKALGPEHPAVATALNNRAWLLSEQVRTIRMFQEMSRGIILTVLVSSGPGGVVEEAGTSQNISYKMSCGAL